MQYRTKFTTLLALGVFTISLLTLNASGSHLRSYIQASAYGQNQLQADYVKKTVTQAEDGSAEFAEEGSDDQNDYVKKTITQAEADDQNDYVKKTVTQAEADDQSDYVKKTVTQAETGADRYITIEKKMVKKNGVQEDDSDKSSFTVNGVKNKAQVEAETGAGSDKILQMTKKLKKVNGETIEDTVKSEYIFRAELGSDYSKGSSHHENAEVEGQYSKGTQNHENAETEGDGKTVEIEEVITRVDGVLVDDSAKNVITINGSRKSKAEMGSDYVKKTVTQA